MKFYLIKINKKQVGYLHLAVISLELKLFNDKYYIL